MISYKRRLGRLHLLPIHENINLLIVETQVSLYHDALLNRVTVPPDQVLVRLAPDDNIVVLRFAFVRAVGPRRTLAQDGRVDAGGREVVPHWEHRFDEMQRGRGFGKDVPINLNLDGTR